jgi:uncharacterized protein (DUF2147 family)
MKKKVWIDSIHPSKFARTLAMSGALCVILAGASGALATGANDPHGLWLRPEGGIQFSFYDCDGLLCAKVVAAEKAEDQASIGTVILRGAKQTGPNEWKGKLYNAEDGNTYDGVITMKNPGELTLQGCLWGVVCSDETWKRVSLGPGSKTGGAAGT